MKTSEYAFWMALGSMSFLTNTISVAANAVRNPGMALISLLMAGASIGWMAVISSDNRKR